MKFTIIKLILCLFLISGCTQIIHLPEGGVRPKKPNFSLSKKAQKLKNIELIDTTTIYIGKFKSGIKLDTLYYFMRFFNNGRVYSSTLLDTLPTNDDMNNLKKGMIGYYYLNGNELITEIFYPQNFGQYRVEHGKIKGDTLIFYKEKHSLFSTYTSNEISKILVKYKNSKLVLWSHPDW